MSKRDSQIVRIHKDLVNLLNEIIKIESKPGILQMSIIGASKLMAIKIKRAGGIRPEVEIEKDRIL